MQAGYFSTAWADIKNSPGWFGKVCLLGLLSFVPIFGSMVLYGYSYAWARDIAWNIHQPMPAKIFGNEDGKLYSRGIYAWLIFFVASFAASLVSLIVGDSSYSTMILLVLSLFLSMFASIGAMRMAIYGRLSAGFQLKKMWSMMTHDFNGLLRILGMVVLFTFAFGIALAILIIVVIMASTIIGFATAGASIDWAALEYSLTYGGGNVYGQLASALGVLAPMLGFGMIFILAAFFFAMCGSVWISLLQARAMGYWVRQFEVDKWRGQDDPMPFEVANAQATAAMAAAPAPVAAQPADVAQEQSASVQPEAASDTEAGHAQPDAASQCEAASRPQEAEVQADPAPAKASFCPSCGQRIEGENARFCVMCGERLS